MKTLPIDVDEFNLPLPLINHEYRKPEVVKEIQKALKKLASGTTRSMYLFQESTFSARTIAISILPLELPFLTRQPRLHGVTVTCHRLMPSMIC